MMNFKWQTLVAGCAVLVALLFVVAEVEARRGGGGGGRGGGRSFSRSGPAASGSVRSHKSMGSQRGGNQMSQRDHRGADRGDRRGDRNDARKENREDWQDHRDDVREDRQDFAEDVYDDRRDYYDDRYRRRVGVSITYATFSSLSCDTIHVGGVTYYQCGHDWYSRSYRGGNVTYIVVNAPAGY